MSAVSGYSKKQVNRAGRALRDFDVANLSDPGEVLIAIDAVDWWRARHAKPLGQINAGLRHYVRKAGTETFGRNPSSRTLVVCGPD